MDIRDTAFCGDQHGHCIGSKKVARLSHTAMARCTRTGGYRGSAPYHVGGLVNHQHKTAIPRGSIIPLHRFPVDIRQQREDIGDLLDDLIAAAAPKSPQDKPLRLYERYTRWCASQNRTDVQSRRLARRFLKLMKRGKI